MPIGRESKTDASLPHYAHGGSQARPCAGEHRGGPRRGSPRASERSHPADSRSEKNRSTFGGDAADGLVNRAAVFRELFEEGFCKRLALKDARGLCPHRHVLQSADVGRLAIDGAQQARKLMALGDKRLIEVFGQFARQTLRLDQHLPQRQLLVGPFGHRKISASERIAWAAALVSLQRT